MVPLRKPEISRDDRKTDREKLKEKLREILKREKRDFYSEDDKVTYYMNKLVNSLKLSPYVTNYFFKEFK